MDLNIKDNLHKHLKKYVTKEGHNFFIEIGDLIASKGLSSGEIIFELFNLICFQISTIDYPHGKTIDDGFYDARNMFEYIIEVAKQIEKENGSE